jgi:hypothetical protein
VLRQIYLSESADDTKDGLSREADGLWPEISKVVSFRQPQAQPDGLFD